MSRNNNPSDHQLQGRLQPGVGGEISGGGISGNNVHELSSSLRRALFRCPHCDIVIVHYSYLYAISLQSLPAWCFNCRSFNPQWQFEVADYYQGWENWMNALFSRENQNRGAAAAGFARAAEIVNNGGWSMEDQQRWEYLINVQVYEFQNSRAAAQRTEEEDNNGGNDFLQERIWKYLITRDCRKCRNKEKEEDGEGEICVICQREFEEDEVFKRLDCGHDYHYECIRQWLLLKNSCPLCISRVIPSDFEAECDFVFNYD